MAGPLQLIMQPVSATPSYLVKTDFYDTLDKASPLASRPPIAPKILSADILDGAHPYHLRKKALQYARRCPEAIPDVIARLNTAESQSFVLGEIAHFEPLSPCFPNVGKALVQRFGDGDASPEVTEIVGRILEKGVGEWFSSVDQVPYWLFPGLCRAILARWSDRTGNLASPSATQVEGAPLECKAVALLTGLLAPAKFAKCLSPLLTSRLNADRLKAYQFWRFLIYRAHVSGQIEHTILEKIFERAERNDQVELRRQETWTMLQRCRETGTINIEDWL